MPEYAFADSSFLVARFNVRDRDHRAAIEFLEAQKGAGPDAFRLVFSDYVFDETVTALVVRSKRHDLASAAGRAILESKNLRLVRIEPPRLRGGLEALRPALREALVLHGLHVARIDGEPGPSQGARLRSKLRRGGLRDDSLAGVLFGSVVREVPSPARGPLLLRARRGPPWKATLRGLLGGTSRRRTCSPGRAQAKLQIPDLPTATGSRTNRRAEGTTPRGRPRTGRQATPSERPWPGGPRPRCLRPRLATRRVEFVLAAARSWPRRASPRCPPPR